MYRTIMAWAVPGAAIAVLVAFIASGEASPAVGFFGLAAILIGAGVANSQRKS